MALLCIGTRKSRHAQHEQLQAHTTKSVSKTKDEGHAEYVRRPPGQTKKYYCVLGDAFYAERFSGRPVSDTVTSTRVPGIGDC